MQGTFTVLDYHLRMQTIARRALFTVLILLTAFRGMVGDAMAYGMTEQEIATNSIAISAYSMTSNARFDSKMMGSMPCHEVGNTQDAEVDTKAVCNTCQVCHLSVTLPFSANSCLPTLPQADKPSLRVGAWASADRKLLSKPPLS